ncbi:hypothetical protein C8Q80DRAFT_1159325 [Daedaleopsis nitida]|nr:hypothetical protein C8Q80DRAFT_1159325 [Daedaleopsis nitida]
MRVLCGEMHPVPHGIISRVAERQVSGRVRLSWRVIEVSVDERHEHYLLYQACIKHLKAQYSPSSLTCHLTEELSDIQQLPNLPLSFGILVNLLADRYPRPDLSSIPPEGLGVTFNCSSVIDFVLSGVLAVTVTIKHHITCRIATLEDVPESDLYQSFFLDVITGLWGYECYLRRNVAKWSPMPWSRASLQELSASKLIPEPSQYRTPTLSQDDLADEDEPLVRMVRIEFGCPADIPWFGAPHDGYPFCSTLSSYTKIRQDGSMHSLRDDAALWVSAMTFGLLEAVMRARIPEELLLVTTIDDDDTRSMLSGTRILRFITHWTHHMIHHLHGRKDEPGHLEHGREVARLLHRALGALDEEEWQNASIFYRAGFRTTEVTDMVCSVALTVAPLCAAAHFVWDMLPEMGHLFEELDDKLRNFHIAIIGSCERRMHRTGWCPNAVSQPFMATLSGIPIVSNIVQLPPYVRKDPDEHRNCVQSACVLYTITDTDAYVPQHVDPTCSCEYTRPPFEDVVRLLSQGVVPAVVYDGTRLHVQPAEDDTYVAISHVWADGMGSTTEVGLPTCQVARIAALVRQINPESDGAFWMDSLCVPDVKDLRKRAIKLMANTYRDAAKVLVIDACIRAQCSLAKSWEENLFRIAMSGWVRRVWTLQEGMLARELYFEFADGPLDVEKGLGLKPSSRERGNVHSTPATDSLQWVSPRRLCRSHVPLLAQRAHDLVCKSVHTLSLDDVIKLLRLRSTTKAEDEIIAISGLLPSLDVGRLLAITGPEAAALRMKECLLQLREVSRRLVMHIVPRLDLPGFRWAPSSFAKAIEGALAKHRAAICTEDGLAGNFLLAAFDKPVFATMEDRLSSGDSFRILLTHPASDSTYMLRVYMDTHTTPFDALLFLDKDLSASKAMCAAVRCRTRAGVGATEEKECTPDPLYLSYVAPARLSRMSLPPDQFSLPDMPVMGPLCDKDVLLS